MKERPSDGPSMTPQGSTSFVESLLRVSTVGLLCLVILILGLLLAEVQIVPRYGIFIIWTVATWLSVQRSTSSRRE